MFLIILLSMRREGSQLYEYSRYLPLVRSARYLTWRSTFLAIRIASQNLAKSAQVAMYVPIAFFLLYYQVTCYEIFGPILATSPEPPFVNVSGQKSSYNALVARDVFYLLAQRLNFTFEITHPSDFRFGGLNNGQWDGIIGQLLRKEADIGVSLNALTFSRYTAIDFSVPVLFDTTAILIPFPNETSKITVSFKPFRPEVWSLVIFAIILLASIMILEEHVWNAQNQASIKPYKHGAGSAATMYLLSVITGQGSTLYENRIVLRIAAGAWCLTCIVFIYVYTGVLISMMTVPRFNPIINTLEELATSSQIKPITIKSTAVDDMMLNSNSGTYQLIGNIFRQYPNETLIANTGEGLRKVASGNYGFLEPTMSLRLIIDSDYQEFKYCRVTLAKQKFYARSFGYTLPKNSPLKDNIDKQILLLQQFGHVSYIQKRMRSRQDSCSIKSTTITAKRSPLNLWQLSSAFIILGTGCTISLAVFLVEKLIKYQH